MTYEYIEHQSEPGQGLEGFKDTVGRLCTPDDDGLGWTSLVQDISRIREDGETLEITNWGHHHIYKVSGFLKDTGQVMPGSYITTQDTKGFVKLITFREFNDGVETWQGWEHPDMPVPLVEALA